MFTHVFNAMRPLHHRDPGIVAAALLPSPAYAAAIADGVHVDPAVLRIIFAARGAHGIILVSDKVAQAGGSDGAARLADGTLAGSGSSVLDGLRLMVEKVGVSVGEAAVMAATNPARLLGLSNRGRVEVGCRADLMVLDRELKLKTTIIAGQELA
jgi:N-acetylglucosamine-6-phosphate deacetylase